MDNNNKRPRAVFVIFASALIVLIGLSFVKWSELTNFVFKDFNLLSDILQNYEVTYQSEEILDPELAELSNEETVEKDTVVTDTKTGETIEMTPIPEFEDSFVVPTVNGTIMIEDYSADGSGIATLKANLSQASSSLVRIAMIGDSYIEGDIFSQNIRESLQGMYGGCGVGYVPAHSEIAGFRQSVKQSGSGWKESEIRKISSNGIRTLQGKYHTGSSGATATYKGSNSPAHVKEWDNSTLMFIAPQAGIITLTAGEYSETHNVEASASVQMLKLNQHTSNFNFTSDIEGLQVLGVWLDGSQGISFDNMSLRGNSGISHRNLNAEVTSQMRQTIDYKLIILEFGINALSSSETNYNAYANAMTKVVTTIRSCYPNAQILIMGIGDRGQKIGTDVGSMTTAGYMVNAQRHVARRTGSLFWDIRTAMGGEDAVVRWQEQGLVNSDYIHLNYKGGKALGNLFIESLKVSIGE